MDIVLNPGVADRVNRLMETGRYQNQEEVILDALNALDALEESLEPWKADVEARVREADAEGEQSAAVNRDELMAEVRAAVAPMKNDRVV